MPLTLAALHCRYAVSCFGNVPLHLRPTVVTRYLARPRVIGAFPGWLIVSPWAVAQVVEGGLAAGISDRHRRQLAAWLGVCSGWVFSMVVLGGVTRLTRSGLSMTEWKFTGERPPRTQARSS